MNKIEQFKTLASGNYDAYIVEIYMYLRNRILPNDSNTILYVADSDTKCEEIFKTMLKKHSVRFARKHQSMSGYSIATTSGKLIVIKDYSWLFEHFEEIDKLKELVCV